MMYDELIKNLRVCSQCDFGQDCNECTQKSDDAFCCDKLLHQAADAIEDLENRLNLWRQDKIRRWIPVTERLPEEDESVLVVRKFLGLKGQVPPSTYVEIANRIGDGWVADSDEYKIARNRHTDPLYWMPLPQPPEDK